MATATTWKYSVRSIATGMVCYPVAADEAKAALREMEADCKGWYVPQTPGAQPVKRPLWWLYVESAYHAPRQVVGFRDDGHPVIKSSLGDYIAA